MARYLISFPAAAMTAPPEARAAIGADARAVILAAKAAGVYVFAGGLAPDGPVEQIGADGAALPGGLPGAPPLDGGFTVLELPSRAEAVAWAARLAAACRCPQELRAFGEDPDA